jgi:hypothetical protein
MISCEQHAAWLTDLLGEEVIVREAKQGIRQIEFEGMRNSVEFSAEANRDTLVNILDGIKSFMADSREEAERFARSMRKGRDHAAKAPLLSEMEFAKLKVGDVLLWQNQSLGEYERIVMGAPGRRAGLVSLRKVSHSRFPGKNTHYSYTDIKNKCRLKPPNNNPMTNARIATLFSGWLGFTVTIDKGSLYDLDGIGPVQLANDGTIDSYLAVAPMIRQEFEDRRKEAGLSPPSGHPNYEAHLQATKPTVTERHDGKKPNFVNKPKRLKSEAPEPNGKYPNYISSRYDPERETNPTIAVEKLMRIVAGAEGNDGEPYDMMQYASDYITHLLGVLESNAQTFDMRWEAQLRGVERWREANPGNDLVMPDHADLIVWLLEQLDATPDAPWPDCIAWDESGECFLIDGVRISPQALIDMVNSNGRTWTRFLRKGDELAVETQPLGPPLPEATEVMLKPERGDKPKEPYQSCHPARTGVDSHIILDADGFLWRLDYNEACIAIYSPVTP